VIRSVPIGVQDVAFSGLCSALSVLTAEQKKSGVLVIDLGGGTTDFLSYAGSVVAAGGVLGVGGDHITNDIALAFNIPVAQAERLKCEAGSALVSAGGNDKRIPLPPEGGFPGRQVSLKSLHTVINARVDEILAAVLTAVERMGVSGPLGAGVVLTGGGAHLKGVCALAEQVFGVPCSIGRPRNITGLATATEGPEYATCSGLAQYGFRTAQDQQRGGFPLTSWVKGLFGRG
jgi:cell division protein FtsA